MERCFLISVKFYWVLGLWETQFPPTLYCMCNTCSRFLACEVGPMGGTGRRRCMYVVNLGKILAVPFPVCSVNYSQLIALFGFYSICNLFWF